MKQAGAAILISDKINFISKLDRRDREVLHTYQMKIYQKDIAVLNIYAQTQGIQVHKRNMSTVKTTY